MTAISLDTVGKIYQSGDIATVALQDVTLQIPMGELSMLVGPSGCGKTTLISIATGILSPTSGTVITLGQHLARMTDTQRVLFRRQHIGFIFQQFNLLSTLTAAENAAMPLVAAGIPLSKAVVTAKDLLATLGMADHCHKLPKQLSGGQQQRVAIARSLVHDPALIVCDEPTASLDGKTGRDVMGILRSVANHPKRAVLVVTHDNRVYPFADRIYDMADGHMMGVYTHETYLHKESL